MATAPVEATAPKKGWTGKLVMVGIGLAAVGLGYAAPMFLHPPEPVKQAPVREAKKPALILFGEVVVNLREERLTRYLRVKIFVVVDEQQEKSVTEVLQKQQKFMKTWLITYLSDQSLADVKGAAGVNRLRREIQDQFNAILFPDGSERIRDILFDEFVVQ